MVTFTDIIPDAIAVVVLSVLVCLIGLFIVIKDKDMYEE